MATDAGSTAMRVAVVTVGDELLAGDTVNTNAAWLGAELTRRGTDVERMIVVPDRVDEIARVVNECRADYDAVLVTGGLGPTHDDVTLEGVGAAVGRPVEPSDEAIAWFENHDSYSHDELVAGTTHLPRGARMLPNTVGVAPGAKVVGEDGVPIFVLPGVPAEMEAMFGEIADAFAGTPRERVFIRTTEPESGLIDRLATVRERFDVAIGSYPGEEGVKLRIEGDDRQVVVAAADWLRDRIDVIE